jgi:hypothetical protein
MLLDLNNLLAMSENFKGSPYFKLDENLITDDMVIVQMWILISMYSCS